MELDQQTRTQMTFEAQEKSVGASYLLWFFLGGLGGHRFYLGQTGTAVAQMLLLFLGWIPFLIGWFALGIWLLVDAILIPSIVRDQNMQLVNQLSGNMDMGRPPATASTQPSAAASTRPPPAKIIE